MGDMWSVLPGRSVALDLETRYLIWLYISPRRGKLQRSAIRLSHQSLTSKYCRLGVIREGILLGTQFVSIDSI